MTAIYSVDDQAFSSSLDYSVLVNFRRRICPRDPHQEMGVLDVHHDVLGVVDLLFYRYAKFPLQLISDAPRQRSSLDQLGRISDLQNGRGSDGFKPRPLRQVQPGVKASNAAFEHRRIVKRL